VKLSERLGFPLLGRPLGARLRTPALVRWLAERWQFDEHSVPAHPYRIALEECERRPDDLPRMDGAPLEVRLPELTLPWWNHGACWQTGGEGAGVATRFEEGEAEIRVWGGNAPSPDLFAALYLAMNEALRASGLVPLHAAVVVRGEEATALVAPSGTGKSTTMLRLVEIGWAPLAEDLAWLDPATLEIHGWDRGIRLWPETIEHALPHLAGAPWTTDPDGKRFLRYDALGVPRTAAARLTRLVRLERGGEGATQLEPLPAREAVRTLWEATGVPLLSTTRDALARRIPALLGRVAFGRLRLGGIAEVHRVLL
jgi:hypothetical protein